MRRVPAPLTRRAVLGAAAAVLSGCVTGGRVSPPGSSPGSVFRSSSGKAGDVQRHEYGADDSQFGELSRPTTVREKGVVVIVHGGFWRSEYGLTLGRPLAADLVGRGYTCWNLEYRRVGDGGGWPATFDDVAAGLDLLADLSVDVSRVVVVGHSAGGQLAAWAAGRAALPAGAPGAAPRVTVTGVVSQAGVLDLEGAARSGVGGSAVPDLLGGTQAKVPERYRLADPIEQLAGSAHTAPVLCVHSDTDGIVPLSQSTSYVAAARRAGRAAELHKVGGNHFTLIDPGSAPWRVVRDALPSLLAGRLPA